MKLWRQYQVVTGDSILDGFNVVGIRLSLLT